MPDPRAQVQFTPDPELFPFESKWFESTVGRIHYIDEGEGRPIVFFHGQPMWSFLYRHLVKDLRDQFRCIAVDYPGYGLSVRPDNYGYTPKEHAGVITELVDSLDLQDMVTMGQDWGGPVSTGVALSNPDRVGGLIYGNTWAWPAILGARIFSIIMGNPIAGSLIRRRNLFVKRIMPSIMSRELTKEEYRHYEAVQPNRYARVGLPQAPRDIRRSKAWLAELHSGLESKLRDRPALFTWGMKDMAFPPGKYLPEWQRLLPDHVVVELADARHYIQEDAPDEIAAAIRERFG